MNPQTPPDLLSSLVDYRDLQVSLLSALKAQHDPSLNWDQIEGVRSVKSGTKLSHAGFQWTLGRHGLGCKFVRDEDGITIDALQKLGNEPHAVDVASFETYLESIGIKHIAILDAEIPAHFDALKQAMEEMALNDQLRKLDRYNRYEIARET